MVRLSTKLRAAQKKKKSISVPIKVTKEQSQDLWGILFAILAVLMGFALTQKLSVVGDATIIGLRFIFGKGAYAMPIIFGILSLSLFFTRGIRMNFTRFFGLFLLLVGGLGIVHTLTLKIPETFLNMKEGGGFIGAGGSAITRHFLGDAGAIVVLAGLMTFGIVLTFPVRISGIFSAFFSFFSFFLPAKETPKAKEKKRKEKQKRQKKEEEEEITRLEKERREAESRRKEMRKKTVTSGEEQKEEKPLMARVGEWEFPSLSLLSDEKMVIASDEKELRRKEKLIQEKLMEFGIGTDLGAANTGPTVTQFTLKPHEGIKLNKITALKNDLALALSTPSLRLEAPIPGKNLIGIEIPNENRATVHLKEILESSDFQKKGSKMRLAFGRDVAGEAIVGDLSDMPHLLIAGATGSGKSVGMNTFLISLLYQNSPDELKMILVDPKVVELKPYNNIPHLLTPVITDAGKALSALRWAVSEMMRRYSELAEKGCRNITEYNDRGEEKIPKIVIVIDELADLMMRELKKETEAAICRLAQMARAVGMHLIIATQRPSVDVITGIIKANIPTRIAFAVTSSIDSRTILDSTGAEDLLGRGDMLFSHSSLGKPQRIQGIFVTTAEITRVTTHLKSLGEPEYDDTVTADAEEGSEMPSMGGGSPTGDLNEQAIEVIRQNKKASASLLQRRLSIGYARAARILDELEEEGLIGPPNGAKAREIYL